MVSNNFDTLYFFFIILIILVLINKLNFHPFQHQFLDFIEIKRQTNFNPNLTFKKIQQSNGKYNSSRTDIALNSLKIKGKIEKLLFIRIIHFKKWNKYL